MEKENMIIELLRKEGKPMRPGEIAKKLNLEEKEVSKILSKLKKEGKIYVPKRCYYFVK